VEEGLLGLETFSAVDGEDRQGRVRNEKERLAGKIPLCACGGKLRIVIHENAGRVGGGMGNPMGRSELATGERKNQFLMILMPPPQPILRLQSIMDDRSFGSPGNTLSLLESQREPGPVGN
jgi:hypothetical protein